jgi:uroporphyrinogen decarboxylase
MHFEGVDRIPNYEFGYWDETLPTWHKEGLPSDIDDEAKAYAHFGIETTDYLTANGWICPAFEYQVLEENDDQKIIIDGDGVRCLVKKKGGSSIPHFLEFPIKTRADWLEVKKRFDPDHPDRVPANLEVEVERVRASDKPVGIWCGSLLGKLRDLMGFENIAMALAEEPGWMHEMIEHMTEFHIAVMKKTLGKVQYDYANGWEDIAFNNGPLLSPKMFREFLFPRYQRIAGLLHQHGIDIIYTDCDGNITPIVDQWIEAGYTCMFPVEVHGGTDPVALRKKYGKSIRFLGGVDKTKLRKTRREILDEMKRIEPLIHEGGFIPHVDHRCPPDVSLDNYRYYLEIKRKMCGIPDPS